MTKQLSFLENKRQSISNWSLALGSLILFFLASLLVTTATSFFLGFSIGLSQFISSIIMALGLSFDMVNNIKIQGGSKSIGLRLFWIFLALVVVSITIEIPFYDISFDGQNYHQEGIIQLKDGWNPHTSGLPNSVNEYTRRFTGHFAKGSWYIDACFYAITGSIKASKASNILFIFSGILISLSILLKVTPIKVWQSTLIALILGFNPIWAYQTLSFYVDGQVSSTILILLATSVALYKGLFNRYLLYFIAGSSLIILSNLKFTGVVYVGIFVFGYTLLLFVKKRASEAVQAFIILTIFGIIGVFYVGYGTYVTNIISTGHPFYPLNQEDILSYQTPSNFKGASNISALFQSIFSESGQVQIESPSKFKIPFTFSINELKIFAREEPRTGGFGPLFSGAFLISIIVFLFVWLGEKKKPSLVLLLSWVILFVSVLVVPAAWWARYVPQFYFLVIFLGIWSFINTDIAWVKNILLGIFLILLLNITIIKSIYIGNNILKSIAINEQLKEWKGKSVLADFGIFQATRIRLIEKNIPFKETSRTLFNTECSESGTDMIGTYDSVKICVKR
jgi:hypothetical protein